MAADFSAIESAIAEQQLELTIDIPELSISKPTNSASIAKARLLDTSEIKAPEAIEPSTPKVQGSANIANARLLDTSEIKAPEAIEPNSPKTQGSASIAKARLLGTSETETTDVEPNSLKNQGSASVAKTRLRNIAAKKPHNATNLKTPPATNNLSTSPVTTAQSQLIGNGTVHSNIASASSELNEIKQWELHKSATLDNILLTPNPVQTIAQAPERLPDNLKAPVIEAQKPAITTPTIEIQKPSTTIVEAQKPAITTPPTEIQKPSTTIVEAQKPAITIPPTSAIEPTKPAPQNNEPKKWAVGVHTQFSTTGFIGVDAGYKFSPNLHARLGLNTVGFNLDYASQGINYKASFSPTNVHLLGDYFPFGGGLRLTGGLVFQSNQFNATGTPSSSITNGITQVNIGGANYNIDQVGTVTSEGSFSNSVAPYLGIGFGTPLSPGLGFNFDAGVMFAGSPKVRLRANIPSTVDPIVQNNIRTSLAEQERRTNNDIGSFGVYPVVSVGISYAF
jgi:hypothetical protein